MIRIRRPSAKANCILAAKFYRGNRLDNDVCLWAQRSSFEGDGLPQHPRRLVAAARLRLSALLGPRFEPGRVRPHTHIQQIQKRTRWGSSFVFGGGGGIRTHGTEDRTLDFESSPFDHSGTSPFLIDDVYPRRRPSGDLAPLDRPKLLPQFCRPPKHVNERRRGPGILHCSAKNLRKFGRKLGVGGP